MLSKKELEKYTNGSFSFNFSDVHEYNLLLLVNVDSDHLLKKKKCVFCVLFLNKTFDILNTVRGYIIVCRLYMYKNTRKKKLKEILTVI